MYIAAVARTDGFDLLKCTEVLRLILDTREGSFYVSGQRLEAVEIKFTVVR